MVCPRLAIEAGADALVSRRGASNEARSGELPCLGLFLVNGGFGGEVVSRTAIEMVHAVVDAGSEDDVCAEELIAPQRRDEVRLMMSPRRRGRCRPEGDHWDPGRSGVPASFAGVLLAPGTAYIAYVGEMRVYRFRVGKLEARARIAAVAEGDVQDGAVSRDVMAVLVQHANAATRALGCEAAVEMKIQVECTEPGDVFLVCSGSFWGAVPERRIADILAAHRDLRLAASLLMDCAHEQGEPEQVTCLWARVGDV
ncbi:PP2C family protein-serine/threonine phosphatase [Sorangium sp. So ce693]|uniref:PP2C family protein-serine/threonine phosphatase n=1 Tax=Sorangium sp. So ce693 TaxID=3133318 RepID=UPI003F5E1F93